MMFSNISEWKRHLAEIPRKTDTREPFEQLNAAVAILHKARSTSGIHSFEREGKMGLAIWMLKQTAERLNCYPLGDGTCRPKTPAQIAYQAAHEAKALPA